MIITLFYTCPAFASDLEDKLMAAVEEQMESLGGKSRVEAQLLEIKFHDGQLIRLRNGLPVDLAGTGLKSQTTQYL
ncbi:MAG TPA: hypothetical protein VF493_15055, partial [Terriglobales bacterium]